MSFNSAMANLLEKLAEHMDDQAPVVECATDTKKKPAKEVSPEPVKKAAEIYTQVMGKAASENIVEQLNESPELMELLEKAAEEQRRPNSLGGPSHKQAEFVPNTKTDRAAAAYVRFGSFLINNA